MNVYLIENLVNGKKYVGKTLRTIECRFKEHIKTTNSGNLHQLIHKALSKYGLNNFKLSLLETAITKEELNLKEKYWIKEFDSMIPKGYNMTEGGDGGGGPCSEERKQKLRNYWSNQKNRDRASSIQSTKRHSEETKRKLSEIAKNRLFEEIPRGYTFSHTQETKNKISLAHKGKVVTEETRKKLSLSHKGKKLSLKTRNKMSISRLGLLNPMNDPINRAKVSASKIGKRKMFRLDGTSFMGYPNENI